MSDIITFTTIKKSFSALALLKREIALPFEDDMYVEKKIDGARYKLVNKNHILTLKSKRISENRASPFFGKNVDKTLNFPQFQQLKAWDDFEIDIELTPQEGASSSSNLVTKVSGCRPSLAIERQKEFGWFIGNVIGIDSWDGQDLRGLDYIKRAGICERLVKASPELLQIVKGEKVSNSREAMELYNEYHAKGYEGIVIKSALNNDWWKVKEEDEFDVIIAGFERTTSANYIRKGLVASKIKVGVVGKDNIIAKLAERQKQGETFKNLSQNVIASKNNDDLFIMIQEEGKPLVIKSLTITGKTSGFNDNLKLLFSKKPHEYIGKVIQLRGQSVSKEGAIRHPRFHTFHPNKNPEECTLGNLIRCL